MEFSMIYLGNETFSFPINSAKVGVGQSDYGNWIGLLE